MKNLNENFLSRIGPSRAISNVERKKYLQKIKILRALFFEGAKTNTDICDQFKVSSPTSIQLLGQLIEKDLVQKKGVGRSVGGRKPDLYRLRKNSIYILAIHIEQTKLRLAIYENNNKTILKEERISFELEKETDPLKQIYKYGKGLIEGSKIAEEKILGIGVGMPGLVSSQEGKNFTYFISKEEPESLQESLSRKFGKPVCILNDAKSACLAEFYFGQAKGKKNVLVISMDWGIGLGIIVDGKMHNGSSGFAGEFGHIPLMENGRLCHCGKRGCLETVASGMALVENANKGLHAGESSILNQLPPEKTENLQVEYIIEAANKGDQFAINLLSEVGENLGKGIAVLIQIFNPELILIDGKFSEANQYITIPIQQSINTYCMAQLREKTEIRLSDLGRDAVLLGSVSAVMEHIFKDQIKKVRHPDILVD